MKNDFLKDLISFLSKSVKANIVPISRGKKELKPPFIIYEINSESTNLSIDNLITGYEIELILSIYTISYADLRELKAELENALLNYKKPPFELLFSNELKDSENKLFTSDCFASFYIP